MKKKSTHIKIKNEQTSLGYKVPENYFEDFQKGIMGKIENDSINEKHLKNLGLNTPDNYFENSKKIIINATKPKKSKIVSFLTYNKWLLSSVAAASVALFVTFNILNNNISVKNNISNLNSEQTELKSLEDDAILNSFLVEDVVIDEYVNTFVLDELIIKDAILNFISLDDTTLAVLFVEDEKVNEYIDSYVIDDLVINDIRNN